MTVIQAETGRKLLWQASQHVLEHGTPIGPRGLKTLEVTHARLVLERPDDSYPSAINRPKLSAALGAAEALSLVGGVALPELLTGIAPFYSNFLNRWGTLDGAYGPRVHRQMLAVESRLRRDPATRQAVAVIWREEDAARFHTRDLPCTVNLHFILRDGKLDMHTTMRSNDVFLGVPYDVMMFTAVQCALARCLDVELGRYVHDAHSLHVYERDIEKVKQLRQPFEDVICPLPGVGRRGQRWAQAAARARRVLIGHRLRDENDGERWYREALAGKVEHPAPAHEDFWGHVNVCDARECWLWMGALTKDGHGVFKDHGKTVYAHRRAWELGRRGGSPPSRVEHSCGVTACCNPLHLVRDGTKRSWAAGRTAEEELRRELNERVARLPV